MGKGKRKGRLEEENAERGMKRRRIRTKQKDVNDEWKDCTSRRRMSTKQKGKGFYAMASSSIERL